MLKLTLEIINQIFKFLIILLKAILIYSRYRIKNKINQQHCKKFQRFSIQTSIPQLL